MQQRSLGTHDGSFHADEVTACSLLLLFGLIDKDKIRRTRNPKILDECEFVCDVGGVYNPEKKRFDHHQADYQGSMSSAGMVLLYLKTEGIIPSHLYEHFNRSLILGVDAHDNGVSSIEPGTTSFSQVVSNFMPIEHGVSDEEMNDAFFQAVDFVFGHLQRMEKRHMYTLECKSIVGKAMAEASLALVFDESIPWLENFFDLGGELHPAQFVVMKSGHHWKLRGIPPNLADRMKVRKPLPEDWAGLRDEELKKITNIQGAIFCHKGRFISIWETKEDALRALNLVLQKDL
jgi:uncharacterized UPF0160 family protein